MTSNQIDATPTSPSTAEPGNTAFDVPARPSLAEPTGAPAVRPTAVERAKRDETRPRTPWRRAYANRLLLSDLFVLAWAVYGTQLLWFGWGNAQVAIREDARLSEISYWLFSGGLVLAWMWALSLMDSRDYRVIGAGNTEYVRVARASIGLFGFIAILAFLLRVDVARGYLLIALPLGVTMLLLERWLWRQWLVAYRTIGEYSARVLLVGSTESVAQIARELLRTPSAGYTVVGACTPTGRLADTIPGTSIPVMGNVDSVDKAIAATGADTVAVTSTDDLPPMKVKQISWSLEAGRQHLVLAPSITDIAGPRIHTRPVAGLPLIHVETPKFSRGQRFLKRTVDLVASLMGVVVLSPLFAFLAITVRLTSRGPVLFRQTRVGLRGKEFRMLKFRSMVVNAEDMLEQLSKQQRDAGNEVLFKMKNDPRVTPIGRIMRKYSLDELPQLFNVLGGSMSLVGPRPPLPSEVAKYADHVHRRFLAKPGVTGLWQVSGRSSLSWEESVRLDLSYVENWSLLGDIVIIMKTGKAALAPGETAH
ncbi:sugar transferase [Microbacterium sp. HD4P20]|uniref:sugar transferase n=1 Tax=Microbacterium sp. HD4P20 TaxID=2864874 RepID=UPI001C63BB8D|nr:sugar transferase [Microbacterium sp. HD4P20]MCP2638118.1 sugar transferase [Microbacterium sp. HD4P20]